MSDSTRALLVFGMIALVLTGILLTRAFKSLTRHQRQTMQRLDEEKEPYIRKDDESP